MKTSLTLSILGLFFSCCLIGCSYLQGLFPDKEKDYQYTTEIPLLNWPAELQQGKSSDNFPVLPADAAISEPSQSTGDATSAVDSQSSSASNSADAPKTVSSIESEQHDSVSKVDIIRYDDGDSRLRLDAAFAKSWRVINKALSRKSIEVVERNRDKRQIALIYDPNQEKSRDDSFMDELKFIWNGINAHDKHYFLTLEEQGQQTDIIFLNEDQAPLGKDDAGIQLLQTLAESIKTDIGGNTKE